MAKPQDAAAMRKTRHAEVQNDQMHFRVGSGLKRWILDYARKKGTTVSYILIEYLKKLKEQGDFPDVDQI